MSYYFHLALKSIFANSLKYSFFHLKAYTNANLILIVAESRESKKENITTWNCIAVARRFSCNNEKWIVFWEISSSDNFYLNVLPLNNGWRTIARIWIINWSDSFCFFVLIIRMASASSLSASYSLLVSILSLFKIKRKVTADIFLFHFTNTISIVCRVFFLKCHLRGEGWLSSRLF